ncbi:MAG TPA: fused MFS/spermidine synthase [Streptosporangiaceae bacterium]|nr:fused MFS/spermidine synthase [Streptosporangiaceae bacterium]
MSHRPQEVLRERVDGGIAELVRDVDRPRAWTLLVGGTAQSHVDLDDPLYLEFDYMRRFGSIADLIAPAGAPVRALHLGGGGLTLARYIAATRPGSAQLAVDSDAPLVELVRRALPIAQPARKAGRADAGRVRVRVGDARTVLEHLGQACFDLVIADLFVGGSTAAHLTSAEFTTAVARVLTPGGVYAVNIGDGPPLAHARSRVSAARCSFRHTCLIADSAVLKGRRFGNLVLAASGQALPIAGLDRRTAADPFPARLMYGPELDKFTAGAMPITDSRPEPSPLPPPDFFTGKVTALRSADRWR